MRPQCHRLEPGLNADMPLHAAISLPQDAVGNCRQFAHLLMAQAKRHGAELPVPAGRVGLCPARHPWSQPAIAARRAQRTPRAACCRLRSSMPWCVCTGHQANGLLKPLGLSLPIIPVHGYSITAPLQHRDGYPCAGTARARSWTKSTRSRSRGLGQRVRVAGSAELGGAPGTMNEAALATLYKVLDDWFPGAAQIVEGAALERRAPDAARRPAGAGPEPCRRHLAEPGTWLQRLGAVLRLGTCAGRPDRAAASRPSTSAAWGRSGCSRDRSGQALPHNRRRRRSARTARPALPCTSPRVPGHDASCPATRPGRCTSAERRARSKPKHCAGTPPHALMQRAGLAVARLALALAPLARAHLGGLRARQQRRRRLGRGAASAPGGPGGHGQPDRRCAALAGDARQARADALQAGVTVVGTAPEAQFDLAIDALLGLGAAPAPQGGDGRSHRSPQPGWRQRSWPSICLPACNADTGQRLGAQAVRATHTLSLLTCKPGLFTADGRDHCRQHLDRYARCRRRARSRPPRAWPVRQRPAPAARCAARTPATRAAYGDLAVVGGSPGMTGAALAGRARGAGRGRGACLRQPARSIGTAPSMPTSPS